jgi:hypothetical protein
MNTKLKNLNSQLATLPAPKKQIKRRATVPTQSNDENHLNPLIRAMAGFSPIQKMTLTDNGAITPASTGSGVLDFFSQAGALRGKTEAEILGVFKKAFKENRDLALRALFYIRDVREGQGERRTFRTCLKWLASDTSALKSNLMLIPFYGRWDDLFELFGTSLEKDMMTLINNQLSADLKEEPSLLAKWMPSENASSKESNQQAKKFAGFMGLSARNYRRILSYLRDKINIVETQMCQKNWGCINYEHVPSRAAMIYRKAFGKHDQARYAEYLGQVEKGEKKINAGALYPYDICNKIRHGQDATLEAQWKALPNYFEGREGNRLVVVDTSGSMGAPLGSIKRIDISLSLGLYMAERNEGPFKDYFITFGAKPTLQKVKGSNLHQRFASIDSPDWGNTNIQAVFEMLLGHAVQNDIKEKDMPKEIYIISDLQFDPSEWNHSETNFQTIKRKYKVAGYKTPKIVFWNVAASLDQSPVEKDEIGTLLVSGGSPSILQTILTGKSTTPWELMLEKLNSPRYRAIKA